MSYKDPLPGLLVGGFCTAAHELHEIQVRMHFCSVADPNQMNNNF